MLKKRLISVILKLEKHEYIITNVFRKGKKGGRFMETLNNIVLTIQNYMSNYVLIIALLGAGLWFSFRLGFIQVRGFGEGMRRTFGGLFSKKGEAGADGMSSFQALATAIAAQVGTAISGTIVSVTFAIRSIPPANTKSAITATTTPIIHCGIPNAVWNDAAIELDCTALPINPSASVISIAKIPARTFPNVPLNAALM